MALKSTVYKANINIANMDDNYYDDVSLTLAKHPSETTERLMLRVVAYLLNVHPDLTFGKGISDEDEAALWQVSPDDQIELWIELGQIDEKRLKKACNQAKKVKLYCYGSSADAWWQQQKAIKQFDKLSIEKFSTETSEALAALADRTMNLQCSIQDGQLWLTCGDDTVLVETSTLKPAL